MIGGICLKRNNILKEHFINNAAKYIVCTVIFIAGVCIGCSVYKFMDVSDAGELVQYFNDNVACGKTSTLLQVIKNSLYQNFKYIMVYFFMAMTVYTAWISILVSGIKGFCVGFTSMFLIANYASKGVCYVMLGILPPAILMMPSYVLATTVSVEFAMDRHKRRETGVRSAMGILPSLSVIYGVMAISSVYDGLVLPLIFKKLF